MRGASALETALENRSGDDVRVFVVWEPVLATDLVAPTTTDLARCHDARARQYWDKDALVSEAFRDVAKGPVHSGIVWDYVAIFAPGARWDHAPPKPAFEGGPVVKAIAEVEAQLKKR